MDSAALYQELRGIGVSAPYASQLSRGDREPSQALAAKIFRDLGLKLGPLKGLSDEECLALVKIENRKQRKRAA